jgi:hypothetical protein
MVQEKRGQRTQRNEQNGQQGIPVVVAAPPEHLARDLHARVVPLAERVLPTNAALGHPDHIVHVPH